MATWYRAPALEPTLTLNYQAGSAGTPAALLDSMATEEQLTHMAFHSWRSNSPLTAPDSVIRSWRDIGGVSYLYRDGDCLVNLWGNSSDIRVTVAAQTETEARNGISRIMSAYPEFVPPADSGDVTVRFWTRGHHGPEVYEREVAVPTWTDIEANYPKVVRDQLAYLMSGYKADAEGGKLLLWTGLPGTGKTYALRALAREWRAWCDIHYIIDPEAFFTGSADYLFRVALAQRGEDFAWNEPGTKDTAPKPDWRLLVFEDTGELLSADAKERTGTALARFLNLCDGIVGQGLKVQILITTNEEIKTFHRAVTRPGRAASTIRFDAFPAEEADEWLGTEGNGRRTLAELYAISKGEDPLSVLSNPASGFLPQ